MARKPKDSRRLEAKKKRRLKRLQRKSEGGFSGGEGFSLVPLGMEKMSVVLNEFVEPFLSETSSVDEMQTLFSFGVMAWNTALLPEQEQEPAIEDIVRKMGPSTRADLNEVRVVLKQLILRKKTHFANNRRMIAGFDLRDTGDGYHLNVVSSLDLPERL
jgi:hypothetical protein